MTDLMLDIFSHADLKSLLKLRKGEKRLGQQVRLLEDGIKSLQKAANKGVKYAVLGVPESIGPMGNSGQSGAEHGFDAFLSSFLNIQSNRFLDGKEVLLLGEVQLGDLQEKALDLNPSSDYFSQKLHLMCETIDERVEPIVRLIVEHGLIPILIGGGHNNALPIITGVANILGPINVLNFDAHADFRALEGRHSGNGFSYAMQRKKLSKYAVFGLHQNYNGENMLKSMDALESVKYTFMEDIQYADRLLLDSIEFLSDEGRARGIEVDMDAIRYMPSSAISPSGFCLEQMRYFLRKSTQALSPKYLHIAEAAPKTEAERHLVGKALAYLVTDFMKNA